MAAQPPRAWTTADGDDSVQRYVLISEAVLNQLKALRTAPPAVDGPGLRSRIAAFQQLLNRSENLSCWNPDLLTDAKAAQELAMDLTQERDEAMDGEARLQQKLADAERVINRLSFLKDPAAERAHLAEKIADPDKFDGSRDKLESFKIQLLLKTSGNPIHFPTVQHKLRYAFQLLTGKAQRAMRIHLRKTTDPNGEESCEVLFNSLAAFTSALDRHFGDPNEKRTAALAPDKPRQANRESGTYDSDFQELTGVLGCEDTTGRHTHQRSFNNEIQGAPAVAPAPREETFEEFVDRLNELDCRLRALAAHRKPFQPGSQPPRESTLVTTPSHPPPPRADSDSAVGPMDRSASRRKLTTVERARRQAQSLCMYCGNTGHFAAGCPFCPSNRRPVPSVSSVSANP